jgi:hypothetical protein
MPEPADQPLEGAPPEEEEVRHLPVPSAVPEARPVERPSGELQRSFLGSLPAPLVAATGGFLVGVATWVLVRVLRRDRRSPLPGGRRRGRRGVEVAGTRSFLVDVHLLKQR